MFHLLYLDLPMFTEALNNLLNNFSFKDISLKFNICVSTWRHLNALHKILHLKLTLYKNNLEMHLILRIWLNWVLKRLIWNSRLITMLLDFECLTVMDNRYKRNLNWITASNSFKRQFWSSSRIKLFTIPFLFTEVSELNDP